MLLYHGTSFSCWEKIKDSGLLPRKLGSSSNWEHTVESNPETVYLTDAYAMYFSLQCIEQKDKGFEKAVIIEVDTDLLNQKKFVADEDALEQASRNNPGGDGLPKTMTMEERTTYYASMAKKYAKVGLGHKWSLQTLGTCGYNGKIPPEAIKRVAIIDLSKQKQISVFLDPSIHIMNYKFVGAKYRTLNAMIFENEPKPEDMHFLEITRMKQFLSSFNRDGITIEEFSPTKNTKNMRKPKM